ncbi:MAG TPA: Ku protein [Methyloceanibacter sp.]|nr:Ku protein [Methyloceanibacter sp.]
MAPRPYWKGYLKLSLVSCPIALYPAVDASERVSFRQVNKTTGNRLRQQLVDTVTGEVVDPRQKGRGYEVGERQFLVVEDQELEKARQEARMRTYSGAQASAAQEEPPPVRRGAHQAKAKQAAPEQEIVASPRPRIENTRTIEIERFVPRDQIDARYHLTPYYVVPRDLVGQEAFAVIRDALARKGVVGMARVVLSNRERPIMLEPMGLGLRGITLRYAHEIRNEVEYFAEIPEMSLPKEMLSIAEHIVELKLEQFDPAFLEDRYRTVLVSMLKEKSGRLPARTKPAAPSEKNVIDLMEMLKKSVLTERPKSAKSKQQTAAAALSKAGETKQSRVRGRK